MQARDTLDTTTPEVARVLVAIARGGRAARCRLAAVVQRRTRAALAGRAHRGHRTAIANAESALNGVLASFLPGATPGCPPGPSRRSSRTDPTTYVATVTGRLATAEGCVDGGADKVGAAVTTLKDDQPRQPGRRDRPGRLHPAVGAAGRLGVPRRHALARARRRPATTPSWRSRRPGRCSFTVPDDITDVDVDGDVRRWLRARLAEGSYSQLRLVSWTDKSGVLNFLPVVEPRAPLARPHRGLLHPPLGAAGRLGRRACYDDHAWRDLTAAVAWPGPGAAPFVPMAETRAHAVPRPRRRAARRPGRRVVAARPSRSPWDRAVPAGVGGVRRPRLGAAGHRRRHGRAAADRRRRAGVAGDGRRDRA